jgi:hypothetical protein
MKLDMSTLLVNEIQYAAKGTIWYVFVLAYDEVNEDSIIVVNYIHANTVFYIDFLFIMNYF